MTDRRLAMLALLVGSVALVLVIVHALVRDSDNNGPAHAYGWGYQGEGGSLRWNPSLPLNQPTLPALPAGEPAIVAASGGVVPLPRVLAIVP